MDLTKIIRPITVRQTKLEEKVDMSTQLNELQTSVELLVSLLLSDANVKKVERLKSKSKCTPEITFPNDDEAGDGANKGDKSVSRSHKGGEHISSSSASNKPYNQS